MTIREVIRALMESPFYFALTVRERWFLVITLTV
jgi:hypothetical protein